MITWTTYGTWLPGDIRGYVNDGKILQGDKIILQQNKERQKYSTVKLNLAERQITNQTILEQAKQIDQKIEALVVCSSHIHLLVRPNLISIEQIVSRYKSATTRKLWKYGHKGRIWTKGYDKRFCFNEKDIKSRIEYIKKHND